MSDYGDDGDYDDEGDYGDDYDDEEGDYDEDEGDYDEEEDEEDEEGEYEEESKEFGNIKKDIKILGKKIKRDLNPEDEFHKNNKKEEDYKGEDEGEDDYEEEDEEDEEEEDDNEDEDEEQDSYEYNCETGDIGEKIIHDDLKKSKNIGKINWMNKKEESFKPYDFKFKKGKKTIYIDAKSTVFEKEDAPLPIVSENEQEFIDNLKKNQRYYIARVFNARSDNPKIVYYNAKTMKKVSKSEVENGD